MLIAVAGLAGVGKSTAIRHLQTRGFGPPLYVGGYVLDEVRSRGLPQTAENEWRVRESMRAEFGRDVLAKRALAEHDLTCEWPPFLLDAICLREEAERYREALGVRLRTVGIEAAFEIRAERLSQRKERALSRNELLERDQFERSALGLADVVEAADHKLSNEADLKSFTAGLDRLADLWISERGLNR